MWDCIKQFFHPFHQKTLPGSSASDGTLNYHGTVMLRKKGIVDFNDQIAHLGDKVNEILGAKVSFQIVSGDSLSGHDGVGIVSHYVELQNWEAEKDTIAADAGSTYRISFPVANNFGTPGAVLVKNEHGHEFYLESVTVNVPDGRSIHFVCNSWIYNVNDIEKGKPRVFFSNQVFLPNQTPPGVKLLREMELKSLQGDGTGERKQSDRIYDYDVYNDLGVPDDDSDYARRTLGGSKEFPYPRRCRTGREKNDSDKTTEKPADLLELIYIPRDEIFDHTKTADFVASSIKAISHLIIPSLKSFFEGKNQFETFEETKDIYGSGLDFKDNYSTAESDTQSSFELFRQLFGDKDSGDPSLVKFPLPLVIQKSDDAWSTDEEFARQTIGGMHPVVIERVKRFPLVSSLDPAKYGPANSSIVAHHIEPYLEGLTAQQAVEQKRLFTLDYHDALLPYVERINAIKGHKGYASRTIFFLKKNGQLAPVAIELSLTENGRRADRVFVPPVNGNTEQEWLWRLAKTHAVLNDTAVHQLISHFLRSHATIEPFIIASHRQLSAMHPLLVLLLPHYKNTLNINALARKILINADSDNPLKGGFIEQTFTAGKYALEISSVLYKGWRFDEQGLPADLIKRGMAEKDPKAPHGLKLAIEDYPYAVDGLEVWAALESWIREYVDIYYKQDNDVKQDTELQMWWKEVKEIGHGDKKDEPWWPSMDTKENLVFVLTIVIWLASAHHAAVNFGQYPFAGYMPYRPTMARRLIPLPNTPEYEEFQRNPEAFLLGSISSPVQTVLGLGIIEILSTHATDEEYLGQRNTPRWTDNADVLGAFKRFQDKLCLVEHGINERNGNAALKNRYGDVQVPYTLLLPTSTEGITNRGIPNSTSI